MSAPVKYPPMTKNLLPFLLLVAAALTAELRAQGFVSDVSKTATNAAVFLEIPVGASAIGMGGAFVSIANDATSLYWNPAGSALLPQNQFVAVHTGWIAQTRFDFGGFVLPLGGFGTLGFSFTSLSMDDMKVRTVERPEGTGESFSAGDIAAGISYARKLTDRFAIGFTGKYIRQSIWHESAEALALDAGTTFKTDLFGGMTIGATLSNFGTKIAFQDYLFLRGGYQSLFLTDHEGGLSLGIGVASSSLIGAIAVKFDYAYRDMGRLESVHTFSIGAQF